MFLYSTVSNDRYISGITHSEGRLSSKSVVTSSCCVCLSHHCGTFSFSTTGRVLPSWPRAFQASIHLHRVCCIVAHDYVLPLEPVDSLFTWAGLLSRYHFSLFFYCRFVFLLTEVGHGWSMNRTPEVIQSFLDFSNREAGGEISQA